MSKDYLSIARSIVLKHVEKDAFAVFLFGSRANNEGLHGADIDVGIWGLERVSPLTINRILDELTESTVPYNMDVVDFYIADEYFRRIALKSYQLWNLPKHLQPKFPL